MGDRKTLSALLHEADSLPDAVVALTLEIPGLTVGSVLAAERAAMVELSWVPSAARPDCRRLMSLAEMLRPLAGEHADLPIDHAFPMLAQTGHAPAVEIATALNAASIGLPPQTT